jgi:hypothetical protein
MRAIVYPEAVTRPTGPRRRGPGQPPLEGADEPPNDYPTKLVKYVPAETLAFVIPSAALVSTNAMRVAVLAVALIGTPLYLGRRARVPVYFYVLAEVSLIAWVIATTDFGTELFALSANASRLTLTAAVFLVPGIDELLTRRRGQVPVK